MNQITLNLDSEATRAVKDLMNFYNLKSEEEIIGWGLKLALLSASIDSSNGEWELIARKGKTEKKVSLS
jgi:hypothetical protein